jgi:hypothetical protein
MDLGAVTAPSGVDLPRARAIARLAGAGPSLALHPARRDEGPGAGASDRPLPAGMGRQGRVTTHLQYIVLTLIVLVLVLYASVARRA